MVDIIYQGTMPGAKIRQLMVDSHYHDELQHWVTENPDQNNKEFLIDLVRAILLDRKDRPTSQAFVKKMKSRDYYETQEIDRKVGEKSKRKSGAVSARKTAKVGE